MAAKPSTREAIEKSRLTKSDFRIVLPEHLATMKLATGCEKDHDDLLWLLRQPKVVDRKVAREIGSRLMGGQFAAESLDSFTAEADFRSETGPSGLPPRRR